MAKVVPTVLATSYEDYVTRLNRATSLCPRVHVDISDGQFTDNTTLGLAQIEVPEGAELDLHLMIKEPALQLETALSLHPHLIILHAESEGDLAEMMRHIRDLGVKAGLAILPATQIADVRNLIELVDHVLVFTGELGHNGGTFQPDQLAKIDDIRVVKPQVEISVDGGVTDRDAALIKVKGADVLYVGSFLQDAEDPQDALDSINTQIGIKV